MKLVCSICSPVVFLSWNPGTQKGNCFCKERFSNMWEITGIMLDWQRALLGAVFVGLLAWPIGAKRGWWNIWCLFFWTSWRWVVITVCYGLFLDFVIFLGCPFFYEFCCRKFFFCSDYICILLKDVLSFSIFLINRKFSVFLRQISLYLFYVV